MQNMVKNGDNTPTMRYTSIRVDIFVCRTQSNAKEGFIQCHREFFLGSLLYMLRNSVGELHKQIGARTIMQDFRRFRSRGRQLQIWWTRVDEWCLFGVPNPRVM